MNAEDFIPYIGKTDDTSEIKTLLDNLGIKKHPKLKKGDTDVYVEIPDQGIVLIFELPENEKTSLLTLADVQLYSGFPNQGAGTFFGDLPSGIEFSDSRKNIIKKLGNPSMSNEEMMIDFWNFPNHSIIIEYLKNYTGIALLHISLP